MNNSLLQKLKEWRKHVARREGVDLFRVLPNSALDDIARQQPVSKEELLTIKGIKEKKFQKYGQDILSIAWGCTDGYASASPVEKQESVEILGVSQYLDLLNSTLAQAGAAVRGEVSSVSVKGHVYFAIKDKADGSLLNCFMWAGDYEMSGVRLEEGMEIVVHGAPDVYKPSGRLSMRTDALELVGEGALKKAYEELKKKLEAEGLFDEARKKPIPDYPQRIGLITSRDGAVINDFMSNIGRFGYRITFVDSRVEGIMAVKDLIRAVRYFRDKDVDVLVIIRGGGSLESLQAFNNESLIREIVGLPMPVLCGIGHDKDVPLISFVADKAVSTPSIVAKELNRSWERAVDKLEYYENSILNSYGGLIRDARSVLDTASSGLRGFYQEIFRRFEYCQQDLKNLLSNIGYVLKSDREKLDRMPKFLVHYFKKMAVETSKMIDGHEKSLNQSDPERQLKLGYSILMRGGKVVKSVKNIHEDDLLVSRLSDGTIESEVKQVINKLTQYK